MTPQTILLDSPAKRDRAVQWLAKIPLDEILQLTIGPYKPTRSQQQNARYWLILTRCEEATGHSKDELHEFFKQKFLGMQETQVGGETVLHQRSSARLKVKDFAIEHLGVWLE